MKSRLLILNERSTSAGQTIPANSVVIFDYNWWTLNQSEITEYLDVCCPGWVLTGMLLQFPDSISREQFLLRYDC